MGIALAPLVSREVIVGAVARAVLPVPGVFGVVAVGDVALVPLLLPLLLPPPGDFRSDVSNGAGAAGCLLLLLLLLLPVLATAIDH